MSKDTKKSFEIYKKLVETTQTSNSQKIAMGDYLLELRQTGGYKDIAGESETWTTFLAMPEIKIPYTTASRYMKIAEVYIRKVGLSYEDLHGLDTWSLERVANKVTKQNYKGWLEKVKELSRSDIVVEVTHEGVNQMECKHELKPLPAKYKCNKCGIITSHREI
jgi:hypothetical protein